MADTFIPADQPNQCPQGSYFFPSVQSCLDLESWSAAYHQAEAAGDTALMTALWNEAHAGGVDVFGALGGAGNTIGDLLGYFQTGLTKDLIKAGVILVGLVLVFISLSSWLNMDQIKIGQVGIPLPKVKG